MHRQAVRSISVRRGPALLAWLGLILGLAVGPSIPGRETPAAERERIDAVARQVEEDIARRAFLKARGHLGVLIYSGDFSERGFARLEALLRRVEEAEREDRELDLSFVEIPAGRYFIGTPKGEPGRDSDLEIEPVAVRIEAFSISTTEITQAVFARVMPRSWRKFRDPRIPAHSVSFAEAREFCRLLTERDGEKVFSLPTEAEWEVACRAGQHPSAGPVVGLREDGRRFLAGLDAAKLALQGYAFFNVNKPGSGPVAVMQKKPNAACLYDMHGNVAEWCLPVPGHDEWYQGSVVHRPIRGGSVLSSYARCRAGARALEPETTRKPTIGFRVVARPR